MHAKIGRPGAIGAIFPFLSPRRRLTAGAGSIDDMIDALQGAADELRQLRSRRVTLDVESDITSDFALLLTTDKVLADSTGFNFDDVDEDDEVMEG
jgi:hypothetical protein